MQRSAAQRIALPGDSRWDGGRRGRDPEAEG
jgi:hypothetical protein